MKIKKTFLESQERFSMIKLARIFSVISIFLLIATQAIFAKDKIIAIVNNDIITQGDLDDFVSFTRVQLSQNLKEQEVENKINDLKTNMVDKLIEDRLMIQEARKAIEEAKSKKDPYTVARLEPEENVVKSRIAEIKKRYSSNMGFDNDLAMHGLVQADLEKRIREQMLMVRFIDYKIKSQIRIRPEEVTAFYRGDPKQFLTPATREFEIITLDNQDQAKSFAYSLRKGEKLEALASRYTIKVDVMQATAAELREEIEKVVFNLDLGGISDPVNIGGTYYVFHLLSINPPKEQSLQQAQPQIYTYLFNKKMQEEMQKWLDEIKKKSYIKIY